MTRREHLELFAAEFRRLMRSRPWTQAQIADQLGVRASAVSRWASGFSVPTWENVQAIAALFETDADRLWGLVTFRAKDASTLRATHDGGVIDPDIAARIQALSNTMLARLADIPRPMWTAYLEANERMEDSVYDLFSRATEPPLSRDDAENADPPVTPPKGPRNRPLAAPVPALANC